MTELCSLPREVLLKILAHLPFSDLVSVGRTCAQLWYLTKRPLATRMDPLCQQQTFVMSQILVMTIPATIVAAASQYLEKEGYSMSN